VKRSGSESLSLEEKLVGGVPNGGAALVPVRGGGALVPVGGVRKERERRDRESLSIDSIPVGKRRDSGFYTAVSHSMVTNYVKQLELKFMATHPPRLSFHFSSLHKIPFPNSYPSVHTDQYMSQEFTAIQFDICLLQKQILIFAK
jgi:hypothetical protein